VTTADPAAGFDMLGQAPPREAGRKTVRPRHAATVIILRRDGPAPRVLMGRRQAGLAFMAGKWVFPGGKVDRSDFNAPAATELAPAEARRLSLWPAANSRPGLPRALAMAAVRETFEEAGLIIGRPAAARRVAGGWREFLASGALADLAALRFIARAVTPPSVAMRFDARFFLAEAQALLSLRRRPDCGELGDIAWLTLDEARGLSLPAVTRFVLREVEARLTEPLRPTPFLRLRHGAQKLDQLTD
jgi:8-oxo-dGTP pyrophosphatase MutT (NUDIX family)